jgi:hypothetical protein
MLATILLAVVLAVIGSVLMVVSIVGLDRLCKWIHNVLGKLTAKKLTREMSYVFVGDHNGISLVLTPNQWLLARDQGVAALKGQRLMTFSSSQFVNRKYLTGTVEQREQLLRGCTIFRQPMIVPFSSRAIGSYAKQEEWFKVATLSEAQLMIHGSRQPVDLEPVYASHSLSLDVARLG